MERKTIEYNLPQLMTYLAPQLIKVLELGRGTGKSTILGSEIKKRVYEMPRATFALTGNTYQQILTRTLPSTIAGLEMLGYHKDVHYVIGKRFPKSWKVPEPFEPPLDYGHFMHWHTGAGFHLVSLDYKESGRGLNTCGIIGDECSGYDYEDLFNNAIATNRALKHKYQDKPLWTAETYASTTPMNQKGKWMFKYEQEAVKDPKKFFYLRASAEENKMNLPEDWFKQQRRALTDLVYKAEILNIRPGQVDGGFYPKLNERIHTYDRFNYNHLLTLSNYDNLDCRQDYDLNNKVELSVALDFGARINTMVVGQMAGDEFRILNALFVKDPLRVQDLAIKCCDYYQYHHNKTVEIVHDETGLPGDAGRYVTYIDEIEAVFVKRGWKIIRRYIGKIPHYHARYMFMGTILSEDDRRLPKIRINKHHCKYLLISLFNAPVKEGRNGFEKDKSSERGEGEQEEATHFSDAFDTLVFGKFSLEQVITSGYTPGVLSLGN